MGDILKYKGKELINSFMVDVLKYKGKKLINSFMRDVLKYKGTEFINSFMRDVLKYKSKEVRKCHARCFKYKGNELLIESILEMVNGDKW